MAQITRRNFLKPTDLIFNGGVLVMPGQGPKPSSQNSSEVKPQNQQMDAPNSLSPQGKLPLDSALPPKQP